MSRVESPTFAAWALPSGSSAPAEPAAAFDAGNVRVLYREADAAWIRRICEGLRESGPTLHRLSASDIARSVGRAAARFLDPEDILRVRALESLPATTGLSPQMSAAVLDGMAADWTGERLLALLHEDVQPPELLDRFVERGRGRTRVVGPELSVQVSSGSVPGVGVNAIIRALLVKSPTLLKPGRGDVVLPVLLAEALREENPALADAVAVVYWPGGSESVEDAVLLAADAVVVYGGDETIRALRARTPVTTTFVAYHNRVGFGIVGREALGEGAVQRSACEVAGAVAFFDQRGCVSPQVVYVVDDGHGGPEMFAEALAGAFDALEERLPGGALDPAEASAVHQIRGTAEMLAASGSGARIWHGDQASWTVVYEPSPEFDLTCVGRVVRVKPVADPMDVPSLVAPFSRHLQTAGVVGCDDRFESLAEALALAGVTRVAPFSNVPFPPPWWHEDGRGPLQALLRWVDLEGC